MPGPADNLIFKKIGGSGGIYKTWILYHIFQDTDLIMSSKHIFLSWLAQSLIYIEYGEIAQRSEKSPLRTTNQNFLN